MKKKRGDFDDEHNSEAMKMLEWRNRRCLLVNNREIENEVEAKSLPFPLLYLAKSFPVHTLVARSDRSLPPINHE
jgi:hypothetical protein